MSFLYQYATLRTTDGRNFVVYDFPPYTRPNGEVLRVQCGCPTDGPSIPEGADLVIGEKMLVFLCGILHDWLYRMTQRPKEECDDILLEAMLDEGMDQRRAEIVFGFVVMFGGKSFTNDRLNQPALLAQIARDFPEP